MQINDRLYRTFLDDGKSFSRNIQHLLMKIHNRPGNIELLRQLQRNTHSLKSEADYIDIGEISTIAHRMESLIGDALSGKRLLEKDAIEELFLSNDKISEILDYLFVSCSAREEKTDQVDEHDGEREVTDDEKLVQEMVQTLLPDFTPFEVSLLKDARGRGERLYRLSLSIDRQAAMPYAKAYLLLSNLEQKANVVRTIPQFRPDRDDIGKSEMFHNITVFLTAGAGVKKIYQAVHIDQVESIRLTPISFASVLEEEQEGDLPEISSPAQSIRVEPRLLNRLAGYVDELKLLLHQIRRKSGKSASSPSVVAGFEEIVHLVDGLEKISRNMSKVHLHDLFAGYHDFVVEMGRRLGKKTGFTIEGSEIDVDRRIAELLSETVLHLLRNGVDHGIETHEERVKAGKDPCGTVSLLVARGEGGLSLTVRDDGRGIDKEELIARLGKEHIVEGDAEGIGGGRANELAALLARPGLTTRDEAGEYSGRGFGLDIVYRKIGRIEGAYLEASSEKGIGSSFTITIPGGVSFITLKMVRWEKMILAVPERSIVSVVQAVDGTYGGDADGRLEWNELPVYSPEGRLFRTDHLPPQETALVIQHLDRKGVFLVDEMLFTREIPEEQFTLFVEESPYLYRSTIGGRKSGFYYLSPSVVSID